MALYAMRSLLTILFLTGIVEASDSRFPLHILGHNFTLEEAEKSPFCELRFQAIN